MPEETALHRARRQLFVSILCRFPRFRVEEDEDKEVAEDFKQRGMTPSLRKTNLSDYETRGSDRPCSLFDLSMERKSTSMEVGFWASPLIRHPIV
jgi:hypothetical protein